MSLLTYPNGYDTAKLDAITGDLINKFTGSLAKLDILAVCNQGLHRAINKYNAKRGQFSALYYNACYHLLLNAKRDKYSKKGNVTGSALRIDNETDNYNVNFTYEPREDSIDFAREARKAGLDKEAIELLELRYYDRMSSRDIGQIMGMSHAKVNARCKLAIDYLRNNLSKGVLIQVKAKRLTYFKPEPIEWARIFKTSEQATV